jgi:basic membrane protein A and related proteins
MNNNLDRRKFLWYSSATLASSLLLKACATSPTTESGASPAASSSAQAEASPAGGKKIRLAVVLPGVITDGGWNQLGYEGVKRAGDKLGAEVAYVEKVAQADQSEALSEYARQGYNLVVGHGGQFDAAIQQVAGEFPETFFLAVNGNVSGKNYAALQTNYNQVSYLAGVVAASLSKTKKLAYLAGLEFKATQQQGKALELGAKSVDPNTEVVVSFTGDFNDIAKGKEAALALISSGVDVIYHDLDNSAPAVLETAQEKNTYAIGNSVDQLNLAPKAVLTSTVQDIGGAITYVAGLAGSGKIEGKKYVIGLEKPDLVHLGKFNDAVPVAVKQKVEALQKQMLAGKLTFEDSEENGKASIRVVKS